MATVTISSTSVRPRSPFLRIGAGRGSLDCFTAMTHRYLHYLTIDAGMRLAPERLLRAVGSPGTGDGEIAAVAGCLGLKGEHAHHAGPAHSRVLRVGASIDDNVARAVVAVGQATAWPSRLRKSPGSTFTSESFVASYWICSGTEAISAAPLITTGTWKDEFTGDRSRANS